MLNWPLMSNNINRQDRLIASNFFLEGDEYNLNDVKLTHGPQVFAFEREFAKWLGTRYAVMVNSGSSANLLTLTALRYLHADQGGEIIVPAITWVSDIAAVLQNNFDPVFVDVDPRTMGMDVAEVEKKITDRTKAVFLTHVLGFNALSQRFLDLLRDRKIILIEDCCEATGAHINGRKVGTFGLASNFSFYYAHHMTTIEGGMVCMDDEQLYNACRMLRSHGLTRESSTDADTKWAMTQHVDSRELHPEFIFWKAGFNFRPTEVNAVIGRNQLKRLDENNQKRAKNLHMFLNGLNVDRYRTYYAWHGNSNYALPLILNEPDEALMNSVLQCLRDNGVEFRRGTAGGGNQLRQPYLREIYGRHYADFPQAEHIHKFGLYIGNYPDLEPDKIWQLCAKLNDLDYSLKAA